MSPGFAIKSHILPEHIVYLRAQKGDLVSLQDDRLNVIFVWTVVTSLPGRLAVCGASSGWCHCLMNSTSGQPIDSGPLSLWCGSLEYLPASRGLPFWPGVNESRTSTFEFTIHTFTGHWPSVCNTWWSSCCGLCVIQLFIPLEWWPCVLGPNTE